MQQNALALALLIGSFGLTAHAVAAPKPAAPQVPQVIEPASLPGLQAIRTDVPATQLAPAADSVAPMPDQDQDAPAVESSGQTKVMPTLMVEKSHYQGDGYAAGSSDHERAIQPAAGLLMNVPLN